MEEIKYLEMFRDLKINKKELSLNLKGKLSIIKNEKYNRSQQREYS